jgi:hypothetical protein
VAFRVHVLFYRKRFYVMLAAKVIPEVFNTAPRGDVDLAIVAGYAAEES